MKSENRQVYCGRPCKGKLRVAPTPRPGPHDNIRGRPNRSPARRYGSTAVASISIRACGSTRRVMPTTAMAGNTVPNTSR